LILLLVILYFLNVHSLILISILALIGFNLFQSSFTKFCGLEKIFKRLGLRSELDEIKNLNRLYKDAAEAQLTYATTLNLLQKSVIEMTPSYDLIKSTENWQKIVGDDCRTVSKENLYYLMEKKNLFEYVNEKDRTQLRQELDSFIKSNHSEILITRFRINSQDEKENWIEGKFCLVNYDGKDFIRGLVSDVTETHLKELKMAHLALHDPLTNLPNRLFLNEKLKMLKSIADRTGRSIASIFIDLDNFKQINDNFGHTAGDELLLTIAGILQRKIRSHDLLIRWGGDEFVLIASDLKSYYDVEIIAEKMRNSLIHELKKTRYSDVTMSLGIAIYPDHASSIDDLIEKSDEALLKSKAEGKNRIIFARK
ncbi:MAG: GGDEF domain-containing protein, partial [Spirochaetia bacterium]|nr:GGDEF domain-containing protein [Spirochaetia bacterium]